MLDYITVKAEEVTPGMHLVAPGPTGPVTEASWVGPRITEVSKGFGDTTVIRTVNGGQVTFASYQRLAVMESWPDMFGQTVS